MRYTFFRALLAIALFLTGCAASPTIESHAVANGEQASSEPANPAPAVSRLDAIEQLVEVAFLPFNDAACVVDAFHAATGDYDVGRSVESEQVEQTALIDTCTRPTPVPQVTIREELPEFGESELFEGSVRLSGTTVNYLISAPLDFEPGDGAPVLINLPPMNGELANSSELQMNMLSVWVLFAHEAMERGWVVITPYGNRGNLYDSANIDLMPDLIRWMSDWVEIEGGRPHLGGMGRGGQGAFTFVAEYPDTFQSLMVYPGAPETSAGLAGVGDMPVRMWVAEDDATWLERMQRANATLAEAGADVSLTVVAGTGSSILIDDAVVVFDELDAAR